MHLFAHISLCLQLIVASLAATIPDMTDLNLSKQPNATSAWGTTLFAGANIAGFEFGCDNQGHCDLGAIEPPLLHIPPTYSDDPTKDGPAQMAHLVRDDGLNAFRLPVSWQYLTNGTLETLDGGAAAALDPANFGHYDRLVRSCLATGAYCQLDVHNYGRWQGARIGAPGGPSNEQFARLWGALAARYAGDARVWFGIMNEPHDMGGPRDASSDPAAAAAAAGSWAATVQAAVTAIRAAGAASQLISLPGDGWQTPGALLGGGAVRAEALARVANPDGSAAGLVFDVHLYLDADGSGTRAACVTDGVEAAWAPLAAWLRARGRAAVVSETGGADSPSCRARVCRALEYFGENSDVYLGYMLWAAGSFKPTYLLSLTQAEEDGSWRDSGILGSCVAQQRRQGDRSWGVSDGRGRDWGRALLFRSPGNV